MNIEAIRKTAIHWVDAEGDHIVESPLCPMVAGVGDTEAEAWQIFGEILEDHIVALKAGRVGRGPGRPAKAKVRFTVEIQPDIKEALASLAKELKISQGEALEYCVAFLRAKKV